MPIKVFKGSLEYCLNNKQLFLIVYILSIVIEILLNVFDGVFYDLTSLILGIIIGGYCLQIIQDVINGGESLPKIMPKKIITLGVKGAVIFTFYTLIEFALLSIVSSSLNFPDFDLEKFLLNPTQFLNMLYNHDAVSFTIFVVSGFAISYVAMFFMEMALAKLADSEKLRKSFNFRKIKHAIDIIGWKNYTIGYTKIIIVVMILTDIIRFLNNYDGFNLIIGSLILLITFIVESIGMGNVYRAYIENKQKD